MAQKYDKWIVCVGNDINKCEMAQKCGKRLKYDYDKWLSCVRNGLNNQKIAQKCLKWLNYVGNDFDMCQMP